MAIGLWSSFCAFSLIPVLLQFFGAPVAAPAPQPQPAPAPVAAEPIAPKKESWEDEEKPAEAAPVEQKAAPVASSSSSSSAPAQPTTSKFVIEDDDMEEDGPEDGEPTVGGTFIFFRSPHVIRKFVLRALDFWRCLRPIRDEAK